MERFRFVTVVWGADFTDAFLKVCLPSQLFPGNLVHFARHSDSIYRVYTTAKDAEIIQNSSAYRDLSAIMPVEIAVISGMSYVGKYHAMTQCHAHFIRSSRNDDCAFVFLSPDVVWADGAFARLLEISESGKRLVAVVSNRLVKETFVPALLKQYSKDGILQPITSRQLVKLALDHLHPETVSNLWDPKKNTGLYRLVNQEGILGRSFHLFPLMVRPVDRDAVPTHAIDADYSSKACPHPADVCVVQDSDEMCFMDFTSISDVNEPIAGGVEAMADWARENTNALNREFVKHKIRFHWDDLSEKWTEIEQQSDVFVESILSLIEDSGNASAPAPPSRMRYFSPRFLAGKVRQKGTIGFLKRVFSTVVHPVMRRIYGPDIRIRMVTDAHYDSSEKG